MGSGASTLNRLRKAIIIRAYNLRPEDQSLMEQFLPFTYQKEGQGLYITLANVKKCLSLDSGDYQWMVDLMQALFTKSQPSNDSSQTPELYFYDLIQFLETGKIVSDVIYIFLCFSVKYS